jgi:hypothetical protein
MACTTTSHCTLYTVHITHTSPATSAHEATLVQSGTFATGVLADGAHRHTLQFVLVQSLALE